MTSRMLYALRYLREYVNHLKKEKMQKFCEHRRPLKIVERYWHYVEIITAIIVNTWKRRQRG